MEWLYTWAAVFCLGFFLNLSDARINGKSLKVMSDGLITLSVFAMFINIILIIWG